MWAALWKALFSFGAEVAKLLSLNRTLKAGQAEEKVEAQNEYIAKEAIADNAIANVDSLPIDADPANRANKRKVRAVRKAKHN